MFLPLSAFTNATIMQSEIDIGSAGSGASKTGDKRAMVGQAPYVVNAGLTYAPEGSSLSATVLYNVVGKRIVSAAERPLPDVYEQSRNVVDVAVRFPLLNRFAGRIDVKNVLDSPYEITQGVATRERYNAGRVYSVGLSWRP
jgi:outer membrane receptor protein involved in Fe transport